MRHLTLLTTGGTIEKVYDERTGALENRGTMIREMLDQLRLEETRVHTVELMSKDSLVMTDDDRAAVVAAVRRALAGSEGPCDGVVILHGTDTLCQTGERLARDLAADGGPRAAVVLTGAMRPYEMKRSDALQNLTEALFAAGGAVGPGVYVAAHGRALRFPGVVKDRDRGTFVRAAR
ncbi:MAG: asparaginase [Phycisphaerae bacterium]|nr:asparaginase [Phycisphaerae bacterium]